MEDITQERNLLRVKRLRELMKLHGLNQTGLSEVSGVSRKHISNVLRVRPDANLGEGAAAKIITGLNKAFPARGYRLDWLLGNDDFMTFGEEFRAHADELTEGSKNHKLIVSSVATLMSFYGIEWDGNLHSAMRYRKKDGQTYRLPDTPPASYNFNGVDLYDWELDLIADRIFELVGHELTFVAKMKEAHNQEKQKS